MDEGTWRDEKEDQIAQLKFVKPKEHVRIVTKQAMWFDMDKPPGFDMATFVTSIRSVGFLLNDSIYQPAEGIASIFVWSEDAPPQNQHAVIPFPEKPA